MPEMAPKKWVFDTVVLSNFLLSKSESLLTKRYCSKGVISSQVVTEIDQGIAKGHDLSGFEDFVQAAAFQIEDMDRNSRQMFTHLLQQLGAGKASCIAIARHKGYTVVTDDRKARVICKEFGLHFTGTIGILKACCESQQITADVADNTLGRMVAAGFFSPVKSISCLLDPL